MERKQTKDGVVNGRLVSKLMLIRTIAVVLRMHVAPADTAQFCLQHQQCKQVLSARAAVAEKPGCKLPGCEGADRVQGKVQSCTAFKPGLFKTAFSLHNCSEYTFMLMGCCGFTLAVNASGPCCPVCCMPQLTSRPRFKSTNSACTDDFSKNVQATAYISMIVCISVIAYTQSL